MNIHQATAIDAMRGAIEAFASQLKRKPDLETRRDEMKECARLFLIGMQALIREEDEGCDPDYVLVDAVLSDIDCAFCDAIELSEIEDAARSAPFTQRSHGNLNHAQQGLRT